MTTTKTIDKTAVAEKTEIATFAGGCFWCMEAAFQEVPGVLTAISGYTGGKIDNPTYNDVLSGKTGHQEAVQLTYDPQKISYGELLDIFWQQIDPTDAGGQFADRGSEYQTAIFYHSEEQRKLAERSKKDLAESGKFEKPIVTEILPAATFYPAEEYHQDYYLKRTAQYQAYAEGSGRKSFIRKMREKE
ncbi:peptide-methionine (S)-S-oxide reductase MsrA [Candidatus Woesearchaeota archaeon]|nr:peptide-methionine (S)-S-oxide reductase MsrA [Candidatus Woesearchaeota archaeon]